MKGGLVDDPWAEHFVGAASTGPDHRRPQAPGVTPDGRGGGHVLVADGRLHGVRSRYFDAALTAASEQGIDQVVLLAAGRWTGPVAVSPS